MTHRQGPLRVIGILRSCFREKFGAPRQPQLTPSARADLTILPEFVAEQSLKGLEEFSHVWLLSYFNLNTNKAFLSTVHPPRLKGKTVGVFASRSPHRPTPIGLTLARLLAVENDTLRLSGVDLVDGTPIVDLKPYIPDYDSAAGARAGWAGRAASPVFRVAFLPEAERKLPALEARRPGLRTLIEEVLRQDLRNPRDRSQHRPDKRLGVYLWDWDVHFRVEGDRALVVDIAPAADFKKKRQPPAAFYQE